MAGHDLAGLARRVQSLLRDGLAPHRHYHDLWHTFDDVLPAAERLARLEGVSEGDRVPIRAAALLHDTGYVVGDEEHEAASVGIARELLPAFGFSAQEVERVGRLIMATRLGMEPTTVEERIMADADLDMLGREDFWHRSQALRREWAAEGTTFDEPGWIAHQIGFLHGHRYWSQSARRLRGDGKADNLRRLRNLLRDLTVG